MIEYSPEKAGVGGSTPSLATIKSLASITNFESVPFCPKNSVKLALCFDAFGGGFLTDALIAYWFFRRFGIGEEGLGLLFSR